MQFRYFKNMPLLYSSTIDMSGGHQNVKQLNSLEGYFLYEQLSNMKTTKIVLSLMLLGQLLSVRVTINHALFASLGLKSETELYHTESSITILKFVTLADRIGT